MNSSEILGYVLLAVGLLIIVASLWHVYTIFTGKALPAQIFASSATPKANPNVSQLDAQGQMQNSLLEVLPIESLNNTINLTVWLLLIWVFISGGGKIAAIGVKLLNGNK